MAFRARAIAQAAFKDQYDFTGVRLFNNGNMAMYLLKVEFSDGSRQIVNFGPKGGPNRHERRAAGVKERKGL